jgi:hypothetical protein
MKKTLLLLMSAPFLLAGCATYHLSTESLVQQMADTHPEKKYIYAPYNPVPYSVEGNSLHRLRCLDKHGRETTIDVTNHTSIRITLADSSHRNFYFNTLLLRDSTITGSKTHFFEMHIKPVKLRDVTRIEVQKD